MIPVFDDPWRLKDLPSDWAVSKLGRLGRVYSGGTPDKNNVKYWQNGTIPWLNSGSINQSLITEPSAYITDDALNNSSARWVPKGAVVIALAGQGKTKGLVAQLALDATCNQSMAAIIPRDISTRFLFYWLKINYRNIRGIASDDLRDGLNLDMIRSIPCPVPAMARQEAIASFLDVETANADALVTKYEKLIGLLEEKRAARISQAVTKGLNYSVPMKNSGFEWIGCIPKHWTVTRIKYCATKIGSGVTPTGGSEVYQDSGVALLRSQNVYNDGLRLDEVAYISEAMDKEMARSRVASNDVLLNITGASIGRTCIVTNDVPPANVNQHVCIIRPVKTIVPGYLSNALKSQSVHEQILAAETGSSREGLNYRQVGNLQIAVPNSMDEQERIVNTIKVETDAIDDLRDKVRDAIGLVKEHRSALIAAAVTGRIDAGLYKAEVTAVPD